MAQDLIEDYLQQQQELSAVEEFALRHDFRQIPAQERTYEELIPKTTPGLGQQYAFTVDLDRCTGCKACVTGCHNANGLTEDETWRTVGLLYGGKNGDATMQHVTSACHHCLDPACLNGCPVEAYEKDADTGIVKHLDDQCIGCQYCTFTCAYDVPKYNKKKGIVHKCDMCISRLKVGEAPACVAACPTGAIRITLVETAAVRNDPAAFVNIPDAPDSHYTLPTTRYLTNRIFPADTVAVDSYTIQPEHAHWPLVAMLVLTQLSVGAFLGGMFLGGASVWVALAAGLLAMGVSVLHLGRPLYAFRAVLGLKHSWLSREIVAFGLFALLAAGCAVFPHNRILFVAAAAMGLAGVFCSVMVYKVTQRPFWDHPQTGLKFFLTSIILGAATILLTLVVFADGGGWRNKLCWLVLSGSVGKLAMEGSFLRHLWDSEWTSLRKTAFLMSRPLRKTTNARFILGILGGVLLPSVWVTWSASWTTGTALTIAVLIFALSLTGEFLERFLFFRAVVPLKMPGGKVY